MIYEELWIDINKFESGYAIAARRNEQIAQVKIIVTNNGEKIDNRSYTLKFVGNNPQGDLTNGFANRLYEDGAYLYTFSKANLAIPGKFKRAYFELYDSYNKKITSSDVVFRVIDEADMSADQATIHITLLDDMVKTHDEKLNSQKKEFEEYSHMQKKDWGQFVESNKEIIESVDPGGKLLNEVVAAKSDFPSLSDRLYVMNSGIRNKENAQKPVNLITAYGDDQATHPKVLFFEKGWNGYKYWLAYTPLPYYQEDLENPCIAVSNDGINWDPPVGISNEGLLDTKRENDYNSDTHLVYRKDLERMEIWYRGVKKEGNIEIVYRKTTKDGINWSDREILSSSKNDMINLLSPAAIYDEGKYKIWVIDNFKVAYYESTDGTNWVFKKNLATYFGESQRPWHIDVEKTDLGYEMLIATKKGNDQTLDSLFHFVFKNMEQTSADGTKIIKPNLDGTWDDAAIYRSCFLKTNGLYYVWYAGVSSARTYNIGLSISQNSNILTLLGTQPTFGAVKAKELLIEDGKKVGKFRSQNGVPQFSEQYSWRDLLLQEKANGQVHTGLFGVRVNKETGNAERLADAKKNEFDQCFPWAGLRRCTIQDIGISDLGSKINIKVKSYFGDENYRNNGSAGQVMVEVPVFYYRSLDYPTLDAYELFISPEPLSGFKRHPWFFDKYGNPTDFKYIAAYEGSVYDVSGKTYLKNDEQIVDFDADKLCSVSGAKPVSGMSQNLTMLTARKLANNQKMELLSINALSAIQMLYLIEYASLDSQAQIAKGVTTITDDGVANLAERTGATDNDGSKTVIKSSGCFSYRGIENLWGNIWTYCDGINLMSGQFYINGLNGENASDKSTAPYLATDISAPTADGFINDIAINRFIDYLFLPKNISTAANYKDYYAQNNVGSGSYVLKIGGAWDSNNLAGIFAMSVASASGIKDRKTSARLCI